MFRRMVLTLVVSGLALVPAARAYEFAPIVAEFAPSGSGASRTFTVRNTQQESVALQIEVYSRSADETGEETREPDYDSFIVAPPQMVLAPGAGRSVRIQWIGEPDPERELAFRFIVSQLPINFSQQTTNTGASGTVSVGYRYEVAAYVGKSGGRPNVTVTEAKPVLDETGGKMLRLTIVNGGSIRGILTDPKLTLKAKSGASVTLGAERLPGLQLRNMLSGTQAILVIPWPDEVPFGPVDAELQTDYMMLN